MSDGVGAFLGYPPRVACATLSSRKALCFPHHARTGRWPSTERHERAARARSANVQSVRQLLGAGSVSSQTLVGPPVPAALRADAAIGPRVSVWPLSTGFTPVPTRDTRDAVVLAEVWPGVIGLESERHPVRDAAQGARPGPPPRVARSRECAGCMVRTGCSMRMFSSGRGVRKVGSWAFP